MAKKKAAKVVETEGAPPAVEEAVPVVVEAPWEGDRMCLITRSEKDIVARRVTWDEYQALGGAFAVDLVNEE